MESVDKEKKEASGHNFKSGVVALIGPPNAGKSTLLNSLLGQKIAIVSHRPQTTRNKILGIVNGENYQIILLDTPGLHRANDLMNKEMVRVAVSSIGDADLVLFMVDGASWSAKVMEKRKKEYQEYLAKIDVPVILAVNKVDMVDKAELLERLSWYEHLHPFAAIIPVSALTGQGVDSLLKELCHNLPVGPKYYPDDIPTDASERFIVAELIREKVFLLTREEIPYSTAVMIDSFQERKNKPLLIYATIIVERASQKGIIIGHRGKMIARIRQEASKEIEALLDCKVDLHLWLKVKKKWTSNEHILKELGL